MESMTTAIAQAKIYSNDWAIHPTSSGGWQLQSPNALINYLVNPCAMNLGENGKHYQVNCQGIRNYTTLGEALAHIANA